ncbi:MAG: CaiB/BaiF CoA transferase family protein [Acidimicrobiia bacterium]
MGTKQALDDITVVELSDGVAGCYCGKLFADMGATVVKVETPEGSPMRRLVVRRDDDGAPAAASGTFLHLNTNKRSLVVDDSPAGSARLNALLDRADLVISQGKHGDLEAWGLDWATLHANRPRLSVVHISGFGADGPYAGYEWDDLTVQTLIGTLLLQNDEEQDPLKYPGHLAQHIVGNTAALGALAAVTVARSSGEGRFVDLAATEMYGSMPPKATPMLALQYRSGLANPGAATNPRTLIPTGVFPCLDGHVAMMSTPQQLQEMLSVLDDDALRGQFELPDVYERADTKEFIDAALYPWLFSHTRAEATALAQAAGWPFAGVNTTQEVLDADHLHQRGFWVHTQDPRAGSVALPGPWCRLAEGGWAVRRLAPDLGEYNAEFDALSSADERPPQIVVNERATQPPLTGVRIVDLTTVWAGPYAAMLLADLGAEVIRLENPFVLPPTTKGYQPRPQISDLGFLSSGYAPASPDHPDRPWNRHSMNNCLCRNKLSATMDTRRDEGKELLYRLAEHCDVFLENFKSNGLTRMGISIEELRSRNPRLIVVRMPPAGFVGDWAHYTGFGAQFDGLSGLAIVTGHLDTDPVTTPATTYMDCASGPAAALATFIALRYRELTGRGQVVEMTQSENVINHLGDLYVDAQLGHMPRRLGNRDRWHAPQGLYRSATRKWLSVSVRDDDEWRALAAVIGHPELANDERYATNAERVVRHDELDKLIGEWVAGQDPFAAFHTLQAAGIAAAPLLSEDEFQTDAQQLARGWLQPLESRDAGTHLHPGLPYRGVPQVWRRGSPTLGQDNDYVYKQILGVSDDEYARLVKEHHISEDYLDRDGVAY